MSEGFGLAREPLGKRRIAADFGWEDFHRDHSVQPSLPCFVDGAHAPLAQQLNEIQKRKAGRKLLRRWRDKIAEMQRSWRLRRS